MARREIEADPEMRPLADLRAGLGADAAHQRARQFHDQPAQFGERNEVHRRHQRAVGLAPAHQHFGADHARVGQVDDRLVVRERARRCGSRARARRPDCRPPAQQAEGGQREDQRDGRAGAGRCGLRRCRRAPAAPARAASRPSPGRRSARTAVRATSASRVSSFAPLVALRSPITMPSPVARVAVTTIGPPVREMRGISMSAGTSAASHAPLAIARRTRNAFSRSPSCITSMTTSPRALAIGATAPAACRTGSPGWCIGCARRRPTSETSFTGTARNEHLVHRGAVGAARRSARRAARVRRAPRSRGRAAFR